MSNEKHTIAFFDFDGTITNKDTLLGFIFFSIPFYKILIGSFILLPVLLRFFLKIDDNSKSKEKVYTYFFSGIRENILLGQGSAYALKKIPGIARIEALRKIYWHKSQGHEVVVVTASAEYWVRPWTNNNSIHLIATKLEVIDGVVSGKYQGLNCHGNEKVDRIHKVFDLDKYDDIYAYGDSSGDLSMLRLANHSFFKTFK